MTTKHSHRTGRVVALAAALAALSASIVSVGSSEAASVKPSAQPAPATAAPAAATPRIAAASLRRATVTIDLCAVAGSLSVPNTAAALPPIAIPVWGYQLGTCPAAAVTGPGGPVITVDEGDAVTIVLHNSLAERTSLVLQGQAIPSDTTGAAALTGSASYTFTASKPGTFLYEAGYIGVAGGTQHQVAMGLYGALVVRSATTKQAYDTVSTVGSTAYNDEAPLVLGDIDTALNNRPDKTTFDMRNFKPKYSTINGKVYSATDPIPTTANSKVLLRYVNAGIFYHSMSLLGGSQEVIAYDGNPLTFSHKVVAETIGPGQTLDALVDTTGISAGSQLAIYDANLLLNNSYSGVAASASYPGNFGGMMTFINVGTAGTGPDLTGPSTAFVGASPSPTNGTVDVAVTAGVSDVASGGNNVTAAEYFIDTTGTAGTGVAFSGTFGGPTAGMTPPPLTPPLTATIPAAVVLALSSGNHTIYVHGQDSAVPGNWGSFNFVTLNVDKTGPLVSGPSVTPSRSNGTAAVAIHATASDAASGNGTILAAEYFIGAVGVPGTGSAMTVNYPLTAASLDVTIPAATVNALSGSNVVSIRAQDNQGNWGAVVTTNLVVDKVGPVTSAVSASPSTTNGVVGFNTSVPAIRIFATATDGPSNVAAIEGFIDSVGLNGTGFVFFPVDTGFNSPVEAAYADIPLTSLAGLGLGDHTVYVHAKDSSGNWELAPYSTTTFKYDNVGPTVSGLSLTPPVVNSQAVVLSAAASDVLTGNSNVAGGEYFIDAAGTPVNGTGVAMTAAAAVPATTISATILASTVGALSAGNHTISVHAKDALGYWGARVNITLLIDRTPPTFSGITLTPSSMLVGTAATTLTVVGATDPGTPSGGVTGGEYFTGPVGAAGSGTAFTGLTASIPTGSLTAGTYVVSVRIRDAAGNWSTVGTGGVRTATLTVLNDAIFADGFDLSTVLPPVAWTSSIPSPVNATRLNVTSAALQAGTNGLQVQGNNTNYVQENFAPAASTYDARFYVNPNGNTSAGKDIFAAATTTGFGTQLFHVRYRLNLGTPQVQIQVGGTANGSWANLTTGFNRIEVVWQALGSGGPAPGSLVLYVNGVSSQTLTTTSTGSVGAVRLGSVTSGGSATSMYFDTFASKRSASPLIGP